RFCYAIRIKANAVLQSKLVGWLKQPVGRSSRKLKVYYHNLRDWARSWNRFFRWLLSAFLDLVAIILAGRYAYPLESQSRLQRACIGERLGKVALSLLLTQEAPMVRQFTLAAAALMVPMVVLGQPAGPARQKDNKPIRVVIIDGHNNHEWRQTT